MIEGLTGIIHSVTAIPCFRSVAQHSRCSLYLPLATRAREAHSGTDFTAKGLVISSGPASPHGSIFHPLSIRICRWDTIRILGLDFWELEPAALGTARVDKRNRKIGYGQFKRENTR